MRMGSGQRPGLSCRCTALSSCRFCQLLVLTLRPRVLFLSGPARQVVGWREGGRGPDGGARAAHTCALAASLRRLLSPGRALLGAAVHGGDFSLVKTCVKA